MMIVARDVFVRVPMSVAVTVIMPMIVVMPVMLGMLVMITMSVLETRRHRHFRIRLRVQLAAEQQHNQRAKQREQRNEPDLVEKFMRSPLQQIHLVRENRFLMRKSAIRIPSPTGGLSPPRP